MLRYCAKMGRVWQNASQTVLIEYTRDFAAPIEKGEVMGTMTYYPTDGGNPVVYDLIAGRTILRRDNAPLTLEEIEAEVKADPNPLPPLSVELALAVLLPFAVIFLIILVQVFQSVGTRLAVKSDKRLRNRK